MTRLRLALLLCGGVALLLLAGAGFRRYIEMHRPAAARPGAGWCVPGTQHLLTGLVFRDSVLAPSPDGRFLLVAVRQRDTTGDGRITARDSKTLLLLDRQGETTVLGDGLVWQDRPARWSPDGQLLALALPGTAAGWTAYDPTDIVIYAAAARREVVRYGHGINPLWLADGRLAFQRGNTVCVADSMTVAELPPPAAVQGRQLLRNFTDDPWRHRLIAAYSGLADVRLRDDAVLTEGKKSVVFAWRETAAGWQAERLPYDGYAPHPAADGLYWYARRGDSSGNGTYELAQDGVDLMRDEVRIASDVAFNGFWDFSGQRYFAARRPGVFDLVALSGDGVPGPVVLPGLPRTGITWLAENGGRIAVSAAAETGNSAPALYLLRDGALVKLADGPVTQPFAAADGVYCVRAAGSSPGEVLFVPWPEHAAP